MWTTVIVEDEMLVRKYVRKIIEGNETGFRVIGECEDGNEGLERIREEKPDLVISDIVMPGMDGIELLKQTRSSGIGSRFLMLTCMNEFEYARQAVEFGASNYILKLSMNESALVKALSRIGQELEERKAQEKLLQRAKRFFGGSGESEKQETDHAEINKIIAFMQEHYEQDITLSSMASFVSMDQSYLSGLFKRKTGETLTDYLHKVRIEQAKRFLEDTNLTIGEIAGKVGFANDNYFIKIFKRREDCTPTDYRRLNRK